MKRNKFTIEKTPQRVELMQRMASEDPIIAREAQVAFAAFLAPLVQRSLDQKATVNQIYSDYPLAKGDTPTIPIDPYVDYVQGDISIWSQSAAGGLATNVVQGMSEYAFNFYKLYSALALDKTYVEEARLPLMAAAISKTIQEFIVKQEVNGWNPICSLLATATTNSLAHVITATTAGVFQLDDFNNLILRGTRLYSSFAGGSIDGGSTGPTDLFLSPERMADIRAFAYQPMNTRGVPNSDESTALGLPDSVREEIYRNAGAPSIYGKSLNELRELGPNRKLNTLFDNAYGGSFTTSNDLVIALDLTKDVFIRPVRTDKGGGSVVTKVDDQFFARQDKVGWYFEITENRIVLDTRPVTGIII